LLLAGWLCRVSPIVNRDVCLIWLIKRRLWLSKPGKIAFGAARLITKSPNLARVAAPTNCKVHQGKGCELNKEDETIVKQLLHRLIIDNSILRLVSAHLIVQRCRDAEDPMVALRDLHKALDEAAKLVIEGDKPLTMQHLVEEYQPRIDELITLASKLLSADKEKP
jgi:hypothetical protein